MSDPVDPTTAPADERAPSPDVARATEPTPVDAPAAPPAGVRRYTRDGAAVTYEVALCRHAGECVRGLPAVFDTARRPWIRPQNASIDDLERVIALCPTRALKFERDPGIRAPAATA
ncbi:(4Fe-4S)-binding protein [Patulibacter americanus]|uniref:(4Fe-4S)-binding protein n=1 Tax=Patulibacter americanus TaxID=588672 RepID=UPI0003B454F3|nr:(4Fe-4S)-binding protein [Patulibacter americanus]